MNNRRRLNNEQSIVQSEIGEDWTIGDCSWPWRIFPRDSPQRKTGYENEWM